MGAAADNVHTKSAWQLDNIRHRFEQALQRQLGVVVEVSMLIVSWLPVKP